nr:integrase, catalytic region, zinc finger, CCHC-type, peptidase aspartic, catalytic [Tanacetum cinerariifolium]
MSTQQDIYAAGSESHPPMLNKENYVPWSSHLLRYAKSRTNRKLIHNSIINGPYVRRMIPELGDTNREVPTKDLHTADYTHLYDFLKYNQKEVDELKAERLAKIQDPLALLANSNNPYKFPAPHQDQPSFNQNYMLQPMPNLEDITDLTTAMNMALALMAKAFKLNYSTSPTTTRGFHQTHAIGKLLNRNVGNLNRYNAVKNVKNQVAQNLRVQNIGNQNELIDVPGNVNQTGNGNLVAARSEGNAARHNGNQIRCYNCRGVGHFTRNYTVRSRRRDTAYLQTQLLIAQKEEAGIQLQAKEFDLMVAAVDLDEIKKVNANCILMANLQQASTSGTQTDKAPVYDSDGSAEVSVQKDNTRSTSKNTKFAKQSILGKPPMLGEIHALSKPVISNSVPTPQELKVMNNDKVIALGMFMINPFKTSREEKHVPNNVRASAKTKPITVSQPRVFTKKDVNSDSNGLSSTGIDNTKTRRPQPRSNTKNDRVPSTSKSSQSRNKGVKVEEHHRNLLLSKNTKHMSFACNNIKLDSYNSISNVVCAMCKQCLISVNHDVCFRNYVKGKTSHGKKQKANVSIKEKQTKRKPKVKKPKKVGFIERLATPKPCKPRFHLKWSPTGRLFDKKGKIDDSSESESQSDCSNGDNACCSKHMTGNLKLLINFVWKFMGTVRFGYDHVAAVLGFGDLQWGNILIIRVYFIKGLGHNLFSVVQFCDSDLEVAFRRNACFVGNLEGVDLLKGEHSTNLYTINLHEMASASPICLMARASSTNMENQSWPFIKPCVSLDDHLDPLSCSKMVGLPTWHFKEIVGKGVGLYPVDFEFGDDS